MGHTYHVVLKQITLSTLRDGQATIKAPSANSACSKPSITSVRTAGDGNGLLGKAGIIIKPQSLPFSASKNDILKNP